MKNETFGFEELSLWKKSKVFKSKVRNLSDSFPPEKRFRLKDQIIRSSRSINALIAEGHGRFTYPDQIHFCIQARGSLSETANHLMDALDENYITTEAFTEMKQKAKEIEGLLNGYINYLKKKRDGAGK